MTVPSLSLGVHDRYGPEIRDRILAKLQAPSEDRAYHLLTPAQLRALARTESPDAPVLSFYLQLGPERRLGGAWHSFFTSLATATLKSIGDRRERRALGDELERVEEALNEELPELGRGVVFFVCRPLGLWSQIAVSVTLPDHLHLSRRPYVRPLVRTRDEHDRFVLALLSQEHSRFFISQIGQVEEVFEVKGQRVRRVQEEPAARDRGDFGMPEPIRREARVLAEVARLVLDQFEGRYLLISAPPEMRTAFEHDLPKAVRQHVGGEFSVDVHAGAAEVAAAAEPAQRAIEEREEVATLQRLSDAGPGAAAWDEPGAFHALWERRVLTLAVDDTFCKPGARCGACGRLRGTVASHCPACGSDATDAVDDVVELALEQALEQRAALELVRSGAARRLMTERGPIAALLR
jgi:peptide subunit release factor 1 (eRF1)